MIVTTTELCRDFFFCKWAGLGVRWRLIAMSVLCMCFSKPLSAGEDGVTGRLGFLIYSFSGTPSAAGSLPILGFEWSRYMTKNQSFNLGYRTARDATINRTRYFSTNFTIRTSQNLAVPISERIGQTKIVYSPVWTSFYEYGFAMGRVVLQTLDEFGATEVSADFYSVLGSGGISMPILDRFSLEFKGDIETGIGAGGVQVTIFNMTAWVSGIYYL